MDTEALTCKEGRDPRGSTLFQKEEKKVIFLSSDNIISQLVA